MYASYIDFEIKITSSIQFLDGHEEVGPSTAFAARIKNKRGFGQINRMVEDTISELTRQRFGDKFFYALRRILVPADEKNHARQMMKIIYTVKQKGIARFPDGSSKTVAETDKYTRVLSSNRIY